MKYPEKVNYLKQEFKLLLNFHKACYPAFHNSNVFFRDFQYSIQRFLEMKSYRTKYSEAQELASEMTMFLEQQNIFVTISDRVWKLNYPEYQTGAPLTYEVVNDLAIPMA